MASAGVQAQYFGGSATLPAGVNAETGITFSRDDSQSGLTPIPVPVNAGVNFSWLKAVILSVITTGTTTISNRTIRLASTLGAGLGVHFKTDTQANWGTTFNQTGGSKGPADTSGANAAGTAPTGYTAIGLIATQYDNTSTSSGATGIDSELILGLLLAVDQTFGLGPGTASLGQLIYGYDEA